MHQGVGERVAERLFCLLAFADEVGELPLLGENLAACGKSLLADVAFAGAVDVDAEHAGLSFAFDQIQFRVAVAVAIDRDRLQPLAEGQMAAVQATVVDIQLIRALVLPFLENRRAGAVDRMPQIIHAGIRGYFNIRFQFKQTLF